MKSGSKHGVRALAQIYKADTVCFSCRRTLQKRQYASSSAAAASSQDESAETTSSSSSGSSTADASSVIRPAYRLQAGIVLSRAPMITRDLTPFEKAFYLYQRRLNERTVLPFQRYFYYKKGTPADVEWKRKIKNRLAAARDIGVYDAYGEEAWNDELLMGAPESEPSHQMEALLQDAESPDPEGEQAAAASAASGIDGGMGSDNAQDSGDKELAAPGTIIKSDALERPMPRVTDADKTNDEKSLNRHLQRNLYLLVKDQSGKWTFPSTTLLIKETLQQAAERVMVQAAGPNMNTWVVGNAPVGLFHEDFEQPVDNSEQGTTELGQKVFFMKGRIMAGQADLSNNVLGLSDFKWLAKHEIQKLVTERYWNMTEKMLTDR